VSIVRINAIEVPEGMGPMLEERFAKRAGEVENMDGFQGFELLRPTEGEDRYFVYTRWESEDAFNAWVNSDAFTRGHAQANADTGEKPVASHSAVLGFEVVMRTEPK
jgi:heme-degrading monooxygenase HmoA